MLMMKWGNYVKSARRLNVGTTLCSSGFTSNWALQLEKCLLITFLKELADRAI
jgi:hypothetical protein